MIFYEVVMINNIATNQFIYPKSPQLSVVIATLGGETLLGTIKHLNQGTIVPAEILLCIPDEESFRVSNLLIDNVVIIKTPCRGQVAQRAVGFQHASHEFVLQLDDDLVVDSHCVEHLFNALIAQGRSVAVAPALVLASSGLSVYREPGRPTLVRVYYWLVNGMRGHEPGSITRAGTSIGIDPSLLNQATVEVEWLAGGCVIHYRSNLVLNNFFPFSGKAYCEDLFHSYHLRQKGLKLLVCTTARCSIDDKPSSTLSIPDFLRYLLTEQMIRSQFVRLTAGSMSRMYAHYVVILMLYIRTIVRQFFHI